MKGTRDEGEADRPDGADDGLRRLVELTRATLDDAAIARVWPVDENGLRRLAVPRPARRRLRWPVISAIGLAALALVGTPFAWLAARRPAPLTFEVVNGTVGAPGQIESAVIGARIRFSDGSEIALAPEARAQVADTTAVGARIVLSNGRAHTFFAPKPHARWQVAAGPYVVQVTGTIFDVQWSDENQAFDVWLQKGSVRVSGPLIGDSIVLTHGQHLSTRMKDRKVLLDSQSAAAQAAPPAAPGVEPPGPPEPEKDAASGAPASGAPSRPGDSSTRSWSRRMASGDFEAVVAAAERRGIDKVLAHGSRPELAALADAARYTRRSRLAGRVLQAEQQRFAGSAEGREASFFLGALAEDGGDRAAALSWYGRYLREDAAGTYAAQALGRKMLIERHLGSPAAALDAAAYLNRFPAGSYADAARLTLKR